MLPLFHARGGPAPVNKERAPWLVFGELPGVDAAAEASPPTTYALIRETRVTRTCLWAAFHIALCRDLIISSVQSKYLLKNILSVC